MLLSLLGLQLYNVLWLHPQHPADTPVTTITDVAVTVGVTALQCNLDTHTQHPADTPVTTTMYITVTVGVTS